MQERPMSSVTMVSKVSSTQVLLSTVRVKLLMPNGTEDYAKALLDSASQTSFESTTELVRLLNLKPKSVNTGIVGIGNAHSSVSQCVQLDVHSSVSEFKLQLKCYVIDQITSKLPQQKVDKEAIALPPNTQLADINFDVPANIHILMAADAFFQVLLPQCEPHPASSQPAAQCDPQSAPTGQQSPYVLNTKFGYVVAGTLPNQCHSEQLQKQQNVALFCGKCDSDLNETVSNFWRTESVPEIFSEKSSELDQSEQMFQDTVVLKDKKFTVGLPLKVGVWCGSWPRTDATTAYLENPLFHFLQAGSTLAVSERACARL